MGYMNSLPKQCQLVNVKWRETGLYYTCGVGWAEMDYVATKSINYGGTSATPGERSAQVGIWVSDHGKMKTHLCSWWHFVGGCRYNIWRVRVADGGSEREPGHYRLEASVPREIRSDWGERWLIHGNLILMPNLFCLCWFYNLSWTQWNVRHARTCFPSVDNSSYLGVFLLKLKECACGFCSPGKQRLRRQ